MKATECRPEKIEQPKNRQTNKDLTNIEPLLRHFLSVHCDVVFEIFLLFWDDNIIYIIILSQVVQ